MTAENDTSRDPRQTPQDPIAARQKSPESGGVRSALDKIKDDAAGTVADLKDTTSAVAMDAKAQASDMASEATGKINDALEASKAAGAGAIASMARTAKSAAESIEAQSPQAASMVRSAADSAERLSQNLSDLKVSDVSAAVGDFAKRRPVAFLGIGILAGILFARLISGSNRSA